MKKILILGGTYFQIPVIEYAKSQGYHVITCDYLPNNPGHKLSNEYHNVSTTDKEKVLQLAEKLKIDGVLAYASDPAAPTAAYVAEKLSLPGNKYETIINLVEKDLFRSLLLQNGFNTPRFNSYDNLNDLRKDLVSRNLPVIIKPVDSSGSKGVGIIDDLDSVPELFAAAMELSRCKRVIVEDYLEGPQLHGDGFVLNSELVFSYLGDHLPKGKMNSSTTYPSRLAEEVQRVLEEDVNRLLKIVGFKEGGINLEARISSKDGKPYIIEVGPRNGGHFTPDIIEAASGFNFAEASVNTALGNGFHHQKFNKSGFYMNLVLYAENSGIFNNVVFSETLSKHCFASWIYKSPGDIILPGASSSTAIGTALLKFASKIQMHEFANEAQRHYKITTLS
jgi:biotin carboxylase